MVLKNIRQFKKYEQKMRESHQVKNIADDSNDDYIKIEKWKWLWSMSKFVKSRVELGTPKVWNLQSLTSPNLVRNSVSNVSLS